METSTCRRDVDLHAVICLSYERGPTPLRGLPPPPLCSNDQSKMSILSGSASSTQNYRGLLNLMAILLLVTNSRLIFANLRCVPPRCAIFFFVLHFKSAPNMAAENHFLV